VVARIHPTIRRASALCYRHTELVGVQHVTEVHACTDAQAVIPPGAGIHVRHFELRVTRVELVFDFDQTVIIDRSQEAFRKLSQNRDVDCFNIGTGL